MIFILKAVYRMDHIAEGGKTCTSHWKRHEKNVCGTLHVFKTCMDAAEERGVADVC